MPHLDEVYTVADVIFLLFYNKARLANQLTATFADFLVGLLKHNKRPQPRSGSQAFPVHVKISQRFFTKMCIAVLSSLTPPRLT